MSLIDDVRTLKVPAKYKKAIGAAVSAGVAAVWYALSDGHIDGGEVGLIVAAVLGPFGVTFKIPKNKDDAPQNITIVGAVSDPPAGG